MPIILMLYMSTGELVEMDNLISLREVLIANGWTFITAICVMLFSLFHWPCSTTCLTIKKETGSVVWTIISALLPTVIGILLCFIINSIWSIICIMWYFEGEIHKQETIRRVKKYFNAGVQKYNHELFEMKNLKN